MYKVTRVLILADRHRHNRYVPRFPTQEYEVYFAGNDVIMSLAEVAPDLVAIGDARRMSDIRVLLDAGPVLEKAPKFVTMEPDLAAELQQAGLPLIPLHGAEKPEQGSQQSQAGSCPEEMSSILELHTSRTGLAGAVRRAVRSLRWQSAILVFGDGSRTRWTVITRDEGRIFDGENQGFETFPILSASAFQSQIPETVQRHAGTLPAWLPVSSLSAHHHIIWIPHPDGVAATRGIKLALEATLRAVLYNTKSQAALPTAGTQDPAAPTLPGEQSFSLRPAILDRVFSISSDPVIAADRKGRILLFNSTAETYLGWTEQEALEGAVNVREFYPDQQARRIFRAMLHDLSENGRGVIQKFNCDLQDRRGRRIPVALTAALLLDEKREVIGSVGVFHDQRELRKAQAQTQLMETDTLQQAREQVVRGMAGATSHLLNQPLQALIVTIEMAQRLAGQDRNAESLERLQHAHTLVEQLRNEVAKLGKVSAYQTQSYADHESIIKLDDSTE